jgi:hypothetical protein
MENHSVVETKLFIPVAVPILKKLFQIKNSVQNLYFLMLKAALLPRKL